MVRQQLTHGTMLRAIHIIPYTLDTSSGQLTEMTDNALGSKLDSGAPTGIGDGIPYCFDVCYRLRQKTTMREYQFVTRVYTRSSPQ